MILLKMQTLIQQLLDGALRFCTAVKLPVDNYATNAQEYFE